mmetsp:Transcript_17848/g.36773  ORF Transcript_17848/g.36773 Transcript_17848/m.36773 type:complete len:160 (-) Transcript_17848:1269-1748(-)|eukprot:CAMPEP_0197273210 /NCGR_PEP_ID=MMETSP1432-20130617/10965_1 /TAXON_ID=44447 /ORGANISM="Pseudo-nitzschia delicatissima, Strain UNC1205" /LENGTH=159 /DNA_ID=CAMNT_0042738853 /DNA_START=20 /DNA_END=499 /DNA_ORIENTATION=+
MVTRQQIVTCLATVLVCLVCLPTSHAFAGRQQSQSRGVSLYGQAEDNAAILTEFMAKAHEEKVNAMARIEDKYREQITEMEDKIAELEVKAGKTTPTSGNSFAFPATNKDLTDKISSYRTFISDYIVNSQAEKANAVQTAEAKLTAKYEAIIEGLKGGE